MNDKKEYTYTYFFNEGFTDIKQLEDQENDIVENIKSFISSKNNTTNKTIKKVLLNEDIDSLVDFIPKKLNMTIDEKSIIIKCDYICYKEYIYYTCIKDKLDKLLLLIRKKDHKDLLRTIKNNFESKNRNHTISNFLQFITKGNEKFNKIGSKYLYFYGDYKNVDFDMRIYCILHGFRSQTPYNHLRYTIGCSKCSGTERRTIEEVRNYLHSVDIELLSETYENSNTYIHVKCKICEHKWPAKYTNLKNHSTGCPNCAGNMKYTTEEVRDYLDSVDIELLSEIYENSRAYIHVKCKICGYDWNPKFSSIKNQSTGCPSCAGNIKYTIEEVRDYLDSVDIELLSEIYENNHSYIHVKCKICEHEWPVTFGSIKCSLSGCPSCAGNIKYTIEEVKDYLDSVDIELLDDVYVNTDNYIAVECKICNNKWKSTFYRIKNLNSGCKICRGNLSKSESNIFNYLNDKKMQFIHQKRYNECKNILPLPFDFYLCNINLLLETDGPQHCQLTKFNDTKEKLENQFKKDMIKNLFTFNNNISFTRFSHKCKFECIQKIISECIEKPKQYPTYRFFVKEKIFFLIKKKSTKVIIKFKTNANSHTDSVQNIISIYENAIKHIISNSILKDKVDDIDNIKFDNKIVIKL